MGKYTVVCPDNGILFSTKKEISYQAITVHVGKLNAYY